MRIKAEHLSGNLLYFRRKTAVIVALVALTTTAAASDYFVSPGGSAGGNGSVSKPWDLQTALNQPSVVRPGDNLWLRAGTYAGGFTSKLTGTASQPIVVRNYNGERVTIDGRGNENSLSIFGGYAWFWGLEITDSGTQRFVNTVGDIPASTGITVYAPGIKCINLVVHDTTEGFSAYDAAPDSEYYGNLVYYNGFTAPDRNHGHGMYMQNLNGLKTVSDNFVGDNADEGVQIYGSGAANVVGFRIIGNTLYNTSSIPYPAYQYNLFIAGGGGRKDIQVLNNYSYYPPASLGGSVTLGQYTQGQDMLVQNNVFAGGFIGVGIYNQSGPFTFTNNKVYVDPNGIQLINYQPGISNPISTFGSNQYFGVNRFYTAGVNQDFPWWSWSVSEQNSTYSAGAPTGSWVYVRPNKYEAKRANITIYNWSLTPSVAVDLSAVLSPGDSYVIQDVQNFYGPAILSGVYTGGAVQVPMTSTAKAAPHGYGIPAHTAPQLGTFVVLPVGAASSAPPVDTTPPTVSISAPAAAASISGQITVTASASDNVGIAGVQFKLDGGNLNAEVTAAPYVTALNSTSLTNGTHTLSAVARDAAGNSSTTATVTITVNNGTSPPPSQGPVQFVALDTTTKGNWKTAYGSDGYSVLGEATSYYPSYSSVTPSGQLAWTWESSSSDVRDLQKTGAATDRIAATWYAATSFTVDINISDGQSHQVAFYSLDWENAGRAQRLDVYDANTNALLDSRTETSFSGGVYAVWNFSGHVLVKFTSTSQKNAVVSGVFFGGAPRPTAQFVQVDSTTGGNWKGVYGSSGYNILGDVSAYPAFASVTPNGQLAWTWAASTSDTRGLQKVNGSDRVAATWYSASNSTFTVDVRISDGKIHQIALYCVDWEAAARSQTIDILDGDSGALLDSRKLSSFSANGQYLVWNIGGHVTMRFSSTGAKNAVLSGIFF